MKIAYCTIASANYLSRVQVLEKSLNRLHPDAEFRVLLCEHPALCRKIAAETGSQFISPAEIGCEQWLQMAFYYDITEYNTALKPFLLEKLLREGYGAVIYLDPDIEVYGSLQEVERLLAKHDVVLTPHVCAPVFEDGKRPAMEEYIRAGQFNLGFIGIACSDAALEFLKWWQNVLVEKCLFDENSRYFVDQFWAAAIPSFLDKAFILRDPAYNMAYWNVFQRRLDLVDGKWLTDSGEVRFFHFSGLKRDDLTKVSVHQDRVVAPVDSPLYEMLSRYFAKIRLQDWTAYQDQLYSFSCYSNGEPITMDERRTYLSMSQQEREEIGNPFDAPNLAQNAIRINCTVSLSSTGELASGKVANLKRQLEELEKSREEILKSLSWRITAPLRRLHAKISAGKQREVDSSE